MQKERNRLRILQKQRFMIAFKIMKTEKRFHNLWQQWLDPKNTTIGR